MSAVAVTAPLRRVSPSATRAPLEVVTTRPQRRARPRAIYAVGAVIGVFVILLTQLMISIVLSDGAYRISALDAQRVELDRSAQVLTESLDALRSPQHLAMNAESLGMVANASPAYLRLTDGTVLGAPVAAGSGSGLLDGGGTAIGNVLLADVPLATVTVVSEGAAFGPSTVGVATTAASSASVFSTPGSIPAPVTR